MSDAEFKKLAREMSDTDGRNGSTILITILVLIVTFFVWASLAELDSVTRGDGKIVSAVQNQLVQAAEGGVILNRFVSENSVVREGDVLFELDPVDASAELNRLHQRLAALDIKEARLRAEITNEPLQIPDELIEKSSVVALTEQSLFAARQSQLTGAISVLNERLAQRRQDLNAARARAATAERTSQFLEQEIRVVQPLVQENIAPATRLLELQRQLEGANGDRQQAESAARQALSGIEEIETEIANATSNFTLRAMDDLNGVVAEQSELRETLPQLEERVSRTTIRAPMDGIVSRLNYRTPGGYINRGDIILELVPTGEELIVEARILPKDISRIRLGDTVRIRLSAYDSSRYGTLDGRVTRISPDAVPDQQSGESSYLVDIEIEGSILLESGEIVTLIPGMTATVDVLSGKRTVLEYIWAPMARIQELALRDQLH